jgi:soluble P-type ATPase
MTEGEAGVVAFDNTGTLSDVELSVRPVTDDPTYEAPVPDIPARHPTALVGLAIGDLTVFDTDASVGEILERETADVHLALSNVEVSDSEVHRALLAADGTPGRSVLAALDTLHERLETTHPNRPPVPLGVQLVVGLDDARIHRIVAYTTVPRTGARRVLGRLEYAGWEVHIVSGDRAPILGAVADRLGVPREQVHTDQSAADKAETIRALRASRGSPVAMVGDYVNDRAAFEAADRGVLIVEPGEDPPAETLRAAADIVVDSLDDVPAVLLPASRP